MGYDFKSCSIKDIQEKVSQEKIIPALFWLFPRGKGWQPGELDRIFFNFNSPHNENYYKLLGNFFVIGPPAEETNLSKEKSKRKAIESAVDISKLLSDEDAKNTKKSILILSSNFPQNGWGLKIFIENVEEFLSKLNEILLGNHFSKICELSKKVYPSYISFREVKNSKPVKPENTRIKVFKLITSELRRAQRNTLDSGIISNIISLIEKHNLSELINLNYFKKQNAFIKFNQNYDLVNDLIIKHSDLIKKQEIDTIINLEENTNKSFCSNFKNIPKEELSSFIEDFHSWFNDCEHGFFRFLTNCKSDLEFEIAKEDSVYKDLLEDFDEQEKKWQKDFLTQSPSHKELINEFVEEIVKITPLFLIEVEKKFLQNTELIAWDKPRMIGWKISNAIETSALSFAEHLNRKYNANIDLSDIPKGELLNGDIFTDYLHYILFQQRHEDPRRIAFKLLDYFNLDQRMLIVNSLGLHLMNYSDFNEFLNLLGWNEPSSSSYDDRLISYFEKDENNYYLINPNRQTWGVLRICFESYLKDIFKVIVSNLSFTDRELMNLILIKYPDHRFSYDGNWSMLKEKISGGEAKRFIDSLGYHWLPNADWMSFIKTIDEILDILNPEGAHHKEIINRADLMANKLNPHFTNLFKLTNDIFVTMPWHFKPLSNFWNSPTIYSGFAWSHDHYEKKEIRILAWESETNLEVNKDVLVWNPSKINPVMTNYKLL